MSFVRVDPPQRFTNAVLAANQHDNLGKNETAVIPFLAQAKLPRKKCVHMRPTTIPRSQTITANQATIAASQFSGDWRAKKYQRKRIKAYGELNRKFLKALGAQITNVIN
jgi:hypothetical protein